MVPLSLPPMRVTETSPADPLPSPMKAGAVGFGFRLSEEQAASEAKASKAAGRSRAEDWMWRIALACLLLPKCTMRDGLSPVQAGQQSGFLPSAIIETQAPYRENGGTMSRRSPQVLADRLPGQDRGEHQALGLCVAGRGSGGRGTAWGSQGSGGEVVAALMAML